MQTKHNAVFSSYTNLLHIFIFNHCSVNCVATYETKCLEWDKNSFISGQTIQWWTMENRWQEQVRPHRKCSPGPQAPGTHDHIRKKASTGCVGSHTEQCTCRKDSVYLNKTNKKHVHIYSQLSLAGPVLNADHTDYNKCEKPLWGFMADWLFPQLSVRIPRRWQCKWLIATRRVFIFIFTLNSAKATCQISYLNPLRSFPIIHPILSAFSYHLLCEFNHQQGL